MTVSWNCMDFMVIGILDYLGNDGSSKTTLFMFKR